MTCRSPGADHQALYPQDLHIHSIWSKNDSAVAPQQTLELIAAFRHAAILGIADHLDMLSDSEFEQYSRAVRQHGFYVGIEVDGPRWVDRALECRPDYYMYHCYDDDRAYHAAHRLLESDKPVIISHPLMMGTQPGKVPAGCFIEINNRYVWRYAWRDKLAGFIHRFRFVIGSDAHQPNWLNQHVARSVAKELRITESILFPLTATPGM